jgi:hypothetical protein
MKQKQKGPHVTGLKARVKAPGVQLNLVDPDSISSLHRLARHSPRWSVLPLVSRAR